MARAPTKQYPMPSLRTLSGCFVNIEAFVIDTIHAFKRRDILFRSARDQPHRPNLADAARLA